jgi:DNA polymerase I-like protein with 3'-5' exonuclease and polymerase domains
VKIAGFDVETVHPKGSIYPLMPWVPGIEVSTAVFQMPKMTSDDRLPLQFSAEWPEERQLTAWMRQCAENKWYVAVWNGVYDISVMMAMGVDEDLLTSIKWLDGRILWMRWEQADKGLRRKHDKGNKTLTYSAKQAVRELLPEHADYEENINYRVERGDDLSKLLAYNKKDVEFTVKLVKKFIREIPKNERAGALIDAAIPPQIAQAGMNGITIDVEHLKIIGPQIEADKLAAVTAFGKSLTKEERVKLCKALSIKKLTVDRLAKVLGSPPQRSTLLFDVLGFNIISCTDSGNPQSDKHTLIRLAAKDERIQHMVNFNACKGQMDKFIKGPLASLEHLGGNVTYPQPRQCGTYTRRMTYSSYQDAIGEESIEVNGEMVRRFRSGVALHQWQRAPKIRKLIKAPEGTEFIQLDAANQEMRLFADWSGDENLLKIFNDGLDGHAWLAAESIYNIDYDKFMKCYADGDPEYKKMRNNGKFTNLSNIYRIGAEAMQKKALTEYGLWLSVDECIELQEAWKSAFSGGVHWWDLAIELAFQNGYAEARDGSKVSLAGAKKRWEKESIAINTPIQTTGAVMKNYAMHTLEPFTRKHSIKFAIDMHDGLFWTAPKGEAYDMGLEMRGILNSLDYSIFNWEPKLPLPWDLSHGPSWGELKEAA